MADASSDWLAPRRRHNHSTSRPNDSVSRASAALSTGRITGAGRRLAAASASTMPWVAATTLRQ